MQAPCLPRIVLPLALVTPLPAVTLADLAGDWNLAELEAPVSLKEIYYNDLTMTSRTSEDSTDSAGPNEFITFAFYPDPLLTETRSFTVSPGGAVTGSENGQILSISGNRIFYSDGTDLTTVYSNPAADILLTSGRDADRQNQALCLKRPASLTNAELAGDWHVISMINPSDIETNVFNGRLADTFFAADPSAVAGAITINTSGAFSGLFSGTITVTGPGSATVIAEGPGIEFKCNASKNLCLATTGDEDEEEYIILVRKPASLTTADLEGSWRISSMQIPTSLTERFYNIDTMGTREADSDDVAGAGEILTDVFHRDRFEFQRLQVQISSSGAFTGSVSGSLSASGTSVTVSVEGETFSLQPNADKSFMAGIRTFDDSHELILCVKTSETTAPDFEEETDLQTVITNDTLILNWNSGNNVGLQSSDSLGGWSTVEEAAGSDAYAVDLNAGGKRFFRLSEQTE